MSMFDEPCKRCNSSGHDVFMTCYCHHPLMRRKTSIVEEIEDTLDRIRAGTYQQIGDRKIRVIGWTIKDFYCD